MPPALPALPELDVPDPDAPEPVVPEPDVPAPPAAPLLLSVVGGVGGGGVVVVVPDVLPEVPGELVLPVSVGSDLPHALKASKELKASASAGLKLKVFMGVFLLKKFTLKSRLGASGGRHPSGRVGQWPPAAAG